MGHQHEPKKDLKLVEPEIVEKNIHPFLEKNDLTLLAMISPLLSPAGQKLVSFFVNFGGSETTAVSAPFGDLLPQLSAIQKNSLTELAPTLLNLLSSQETKGSGGGINPALLTTLLGMLNNNKKEE